MIQQTNGESVILTNQPVGQCIVETATNQSIDQSIDPSIHQSINQAINQPIWKSFKGKISHSI